MTVFSALILTASVSTAASQSFGWSVKKDAWSATDEKNYSDFIAALGSSGCNTVDKCLKSSANPYRGSDPSGVYWDATDCAKLPYLLRGYFAWKNGLPFGYVNGVASVSSGSSDLRYSINGNYVTKRRTISQHQAGQVIEGTSALRLMQEEVNTAMFRIHPYRDGVEKNLPTDFYPDRIDRESVRPGSMVYDPDGHVVVIYKVETDGRVRYFDAHPDHTVSHGVYGQKFARSRPGAGAGFKNFRSFRLVGYTTGPHGELLGGTLTTLPFAKTPGYSVEQFWGTEVGAGTHNDPSWRGAQFKVQGRNLQFVDFVRTRLAVGELKYHPVEEMQNAMDSLCGDLRDRVAAVQTGVDVGMNERAHPDRLPTNIYGTSGDWEEYSTPSRDARLKTSFLELRNRVQEMVELYHHGDSRIDYAGHDLAGDLRRAYVTSSNACEISYKKSNGEMMTLDYDTIADRLFALSFDPYDCPELRWGANSGSELSSCRDGGEKTAWYKAEQRLRNQIDRTYDIRMDFFLSDLQRGVSGSGVDHAPNTDLKTYLQAL